MAEVFYTEDADPSLILGKKVAVIGFGMLRSLLFCLRHGGIYWRGNIYPLADLRAGQRVTVSVFLRR